MPLAGAEHRDGVPVSRLDEHPRRVRGHLRRLAAHDAAEADDAGVVGDDEVLGRQRPVRAVESGQPLSLGGTADPDRALQLVGVVAVDRATELEHHVVGDVDGQRDRALAREGEPLRHPVRRRGTRVDAADHASHEHRAALGVVDDDGVALVVGRGDLTLGRVGVRRVVGQCRLAGNATQRERVGAVRVDLELDDLLVEAEHRLGIGARLARFGGQHDDAVVVLADTELAGRADHAGRDVPIGLARGDREAAREHTAGQHHDDQVAGREVVRTAHDALRLTGAVGIADVDGAPVDGLAVLLRLRLHGQHPADHQRPGDRVAGSVDALQLEPERGQPGGELLGGDVGGQVDVLADPGDGGAHVRSPSRTRG